MKLGQPTDVVLTNMIPTRRLVNFKEVVRYQLVLSNCFGEQVFHTMEGPALYDLFSHALGASVVELPYPALDLIGCKFRVELGPGPGVVVQRTHGSRFVVSDAQTGEVYDKEWQSYSAAERDCKEAGLELSVPTIVRWTAHEENLQHNRERLSNAS